MELTQDAKLCPCPEEVLQFKIRRSLLSPVMDDPSQRMSPLVLCAVPADQAGGWESQGTPKGGSEQQRRHLPFMSQLAVTEELPLGI